MSLEEARARRKGCRATGSSEATLADSVWNRRCNGVVFLSSYSWCGAALAANTYLHSLKETWMKMWPRSSLKQNAGDRGRRSSDWHGMSGKHQRLSSCRSKPRRFLRNTKREILKNAPAALFFATKIRSLNESFTPALIQIWIGFTKLLQASVHILTFSGKK